MYWIKDTVTGTSEEFNTIGDMFRAANDWSRVYEGHEIKVYINENDVGVYYMGEFKAYD